MAEFMDIVPVKSTLHLPGNNPFRYLVVGLGGVGTRIARSFPVPPPPGIRFLLMDADEHNLYRDQFPALAVPVPRDLWQDLPDSPERLEEKTIHWLKQEKHVVDQLISGTSSVEMVFYVSGLGKLTGTHFLSPVVRWLRSIFPGAVHILVPILPYPWEGRSILQDAIKILSKLSREGCMVVPVPALRMFPLMFLQDVQYFQTLEKTFLAQGMEHFVSVPAPGVQFRILCEPDEYTRMLIRVLIAAREIKRFRSLSLQDLTRMQKGSSTTENTTDAVAFLPILTQAMSRDQVYHQMVIALRQVRQWTKSLFLSSSSLSSSSSSTNASGVSVSSVQVSVPRLCVVLWNGEASRYDGEGNILAEEMAIHLYDEDTPLLLSFGPVGDARFVSGVLSLLLYPMYLSGVLEMYFTAFQTARGLQKILRKVPQPSEEIVSSSQIPTSSPPEDSSPSSVTTHEFATPPTEEEIQRAKQTPAYLRKQPPSSLPFADQ